MLKEDKSTYQEKLNDYKINQKYKYKEYIIIIKREVFRVYADSEEGAKDVLSNACEVYREAKHKEHTEYWDNIKELIHTDYCEIIENTDFIGVRKIK